MKKKRAGGRPEFGLPNSWYGSETVTSVSLERPYKARGVPPRFRQYDLGFIRWLSRSGKNADFLTDDDLERMRVLATVRDVFGPGRSAEMTYLRRGREQRSSPQERSILAARHSCNPSLACSKTFGPT